jgi:hypothetical protein
LNLDAYTEPLLAQLLSSTEQSANRDILIETEKVQNRDERIGDVEGNSSNQKKAQKVPVASKLEERKQLRAERAAQWKALMEAKPDDKYEDPRDLAAIKSAIANMGDYKLKTADNYIVPENERVDADKKKRQIILLNDSIKSLKDQFNAKVFSLRDSKVRIIQQFHDNVNRIKEINEELVTLGESVDVVPEPPTLETGLYPEDREKVTPQDIEELLKEEQVQSTKRGKDDGLGFGNSPAVVPKEKPVSSKKDVKIAMQEVIAPVAVAVPSTPSKQGAAKTDFASKQAELEKIELTVHRLQLKYEKNRLIETLQENITQFDKAIALLSKERMLLAAGILNSFRFEICRNQIACII